MLVAGGLPPLQLLVSRMLLLLCQNVNNGRDKVSLQNLSFYLSLFAMATPLILRLLFLVYPLIANVAFQAFSCYPAFDDGTSFLIADVAIQ